MTLSFENPIDFIVEDRNDERKFPEGYFPGGFGVYLHGELEDKAHYDIAYSSIDLHELDDGVYPATHKSEDQCTLYLWSHTEYGPKRLRGLVVLNDDIDGIKHAQMKYEQKSTFL